MIMTDPPARLKLLSDTLEEMLACNEKVTARAVVRRLPNEFKHASSLTRVKERRELIASFQRRQVELLAVMAKADKTSKSNLSAELQRKEEEIRVLKRDRDLLIGSHKAIILAVSEMGGMATWLRFFHTYQAEVDRLHELGAMPLSLSLRQGDDS